MLVLVACEFSGVVRDAFTALGHDAMSCDLLPSETPGPHYQGDVRDILDDGWDLMIAHPPCTYLANSGVRWLYDTQRHPTRWQAMIDDAVFFRDLLNAPIPRVAVENPAIHGWAAKIIGRVADQKIQPYWFGHLESKSTGLWLKGLPPLRHTQDVKRETKLLPVNERQKILYAPDSAGRWMMRSRTFTGIAAAMADQWGI